MSEPVKHECGIALLRLLKPVEFFIEKYGTWRYGLGKMYLMMEKQRNRGQDGAGLAGLKLNAPAGRRYIFRQRSNNVDSIKDVFSRVYDDIELVKVKEKERAENPVFLREEMPFACDIYLGHLRYGTFGNYNIDYVHPVTRENNWRSRSLVLAGNFNLTNVDEIFNHLVDIGQNPVDFSDTVTVLENLGHFLDEENERLYRDYKMHGYSKKEITPMIEQNLNISTVLENAARKWDGGYAMAGITGFGTGFVLRDPSGIRPVFYYHDDEIAIAASERPVIQTVFRRRTAEIKELTPGHALIINASGSVAEEKVLDPAPARKCSFERIYFSRGTDKNIYRERKMLGELLTPAVLKAVDYDIENTVFSYIPNTAESAFFGLIKGLEDYLNGFKVDAILKQREKAGRDKLAEIMAVRPRIEKIAVKDVKLRTFITEDTARNDLVGHVYDVTYGVVRRGIDNLVVLDDSIVRGTTLKNSIIRILDGLGPKKLIIVSSSPQIRYPDCYGIDMARLGDFIAFRAAISIIMDQGKESLIDEIYEKARAELEKPVSEMENVVREIYADTSPADISGKIASMLKTPGIESELEIVYQSIENLHIACPGHAGDWYFSGDYPTAGGNRVVNRSFVNFIEGVDRRAY
ncbi:MAG: amidophosphoribosyltransferase [Bacteroidales bacterium]